MTGPTVTTVPAPASTVADAPPSPGPLALYRAIAEDAARWWLGPVVAGLVVVAYLVLRTMDVDAAGLRAWLALAVAFTLVSPAGGLLVLAAIAPFGEGIPLSGEVGSKTALALALAASAGLRWAVDVAVRWRTTGRIGPIPRALIPVGLALALLPATAFGLLRTQERFGAAFTVGAAQIWAQGLATMLLVFVATVWIGRRGVRGPIILTVVATTIAGLISLADFWSDATLRETPLDWLVTGAFNPSRLTGVIRSPTSTAALVMLPISIALTVAVLGRDRRAQLLAAVVSVPLLVAAYLTYNRTVFIALLVGVVIVGWRIRRALGVALATAGVIVSIVAIPWYIAVRGASVGGASEIPPGEVLIASDQMRITAWGAATRMFLDEPLLGQGYRSYRQLSVAFGDPILNAPHNELLRLFAEHGAIVGLLGLAFAASIAIVLARRPGWLETGLLVAFLSLCLAAFFNNTFLFNQVTIPAFVLAGSGVALALRQDAPDTAADQAPDAPDIRGAPA